MIGNNELKLSIIVPVYNVEQYIRPCVESIFRQGLDDSEFEVILVNDGTEDNSIKVISDIIADHQNIKLLEQDNQGPSVARNYGISNAVGKYILFVDSDDLLVNNILPRLLSLAINSSVDLLVGNYLRLNSEEINEGKYVVAFDETIVEKSGYDLFVEDLKPSQCYLWRTLYRKDFILEKQLTTGMEGFCFEDIPFVHECYLKASKCIVTNHIVCIYRIGHNSITSSMNKNKIMDLNKSISRLWMLQYSLVLPDSIHRELRNKIFATLSFELWCISHNSILMVDYKELLTDLQSRVPDLSFKNGFKQRFVTYMFWKHPYIYLKVRSKFPWL